MEDIIKNIEKLSLNYHKEIFLFLQSHRIQYSKNQNGVFINMSLIGDAVLDELKIIVDKYTETILTQTKLEYINKTNMDINFKQNCTNNHISTHNVDYSNNKTNIFLNEDIVLTFNPKDVAIFEKDKQKINKKNVHLKFNTSIKKYSKYSSNDCKKFDSTLNHSLDFENYIII